MSRLLEEPLQDTIHHLNNTSTWGPHKLLSVIWSCYNDTTATLLHLFSLSILGPSLISHLNTVNNWMSIKLWGILLWPTHHLLIIRKDIRHHFPPIYMCFQRVPLSDPSVYVVSTTRKYEQCEWLALHTCRLIRALCMFSRQLLHQEHEEVADLTFIAVQKGLISYFSFVTNVLEGNSLNTLGDKSQGASVPQQCIFKHQSQLLVWWPAVLRKFFLIYSFSLFPWIDQHLSRLHCQWQNSPLEIRAQCFVMIIKRVWPDRPVPGSCRPWSGQTCRGEGRWAAHCPDLGWSPGYISPLPPRSAHCWTLWRCQSPHSPHCGTKHSINQSIYIIIFFF